MRARSAKGGNSAGRRCEQGPWLVVTSKCSSFGVLNLSSKACLAIPDSARPESPPALQRAPTLCNLPPQHSGAAVCPTRSGRAGNSGSGLRIYGPGNAFQIGPRILGSRNQTPSLGGGGWEYVWRET